MARKVVSGGVMYGLILEEKPKAKKPKTDDKTESESK